MVCKKYNNRAEWDHELMMCGEIGGRIIVFHIEQRLERPIASEVGDTVLHLAGSRALRECLQAGESTQQRAWNLRDSSICFSELRKAKGRVLSHA